MAQRLLDAGVQHGDGSALNVSNNHPTDHNARYGTWIAECIWYATEGPEQARGHTDWCASRYYSSAAPNDGPPGDVSPTDPTTWRWTDAWFDQSAGTPPADELHHFVIDTSRNGRGAWTPPPGKYSGAPETWCNAPGRGLGPRPTADTGVPLVDASLRIKTPVSPTAAAPATPAARSPRIRHRRPARRRLVARPGPCTGPQRGTAPDLRPLSRVGHLRTRPVAEVFHLVIAGHRVRVGGLRVARAGRVRVCAAYRRGQGPGSTGPSRISTSTIRTPPRLYAPAKEPLRMA